MKTIDSANLLSDSVYEQLMVLLDTGEFKPDMRLPSELEMAKRFNVSRPILRQALARLRSTGHIYSRKGAGNFVGSAIPVEALVEFGPLTSIPDVRNFLEFRCSLESEIAARAAQHLRSEDLLEIQSSRRKLDRAISTGAAAIDEDIAFHAAIARASRNRFFEATLAALSQQTRFAIRLIRELSGQPVTSRREDVRHEHARIDAALCARDPEAARQAMAAHLQGGIARLFNSQQ
jgi:DNA-binding FadR family transcriptional regulator